MRLLVIFIDGHIGLFTSKLKHRPLPLHSIAPRQEAYRNRNLSVPGAAFDGIHPQHRRITLWRANFTRVEAVIGSNTALTLRSSP
jgi:hypothetical protein